MSEEEEQFHEEVKMAKNLSALVKVIWSLVLVGIVAGGFITKHELGYTKIEKTQEEVGALKDWRIAVDSTRYTIQDRAADAKISAEERLINEKRLQRVEDTEARTLETLANISKTLKEIENGL